MTRRVPTLRLLLASGFFFPFAASPANPQCADGVTPTASLSVTIVQEPPTPGGLKVAILPSRMKNQGVELSYRLFVSGETITFSDNCPGKYILFIAGTGVSECGYRTEKAIVLRQGQARKMKLKVTAKKGVVCE